MSYMYFYFLKNSAEIPSIRASTSNLFLWCPRK
eukprot:UN06044